MLVAGIIMLCYGLRNVFKGVESMNNEKKKKDMFKPFVRQTIAIIIVLVAIFSIASVYNMLGPNYEFQREIHGHMENAYYADEPELMKKELILAIDGMQDLGLEKEKYGAFWYFDKTPDRQMDYQYKHLEGIIERIDAVIEWREKTYANESTSTEQLGDVFEQKMDNLRGFLKEEGWSDWIARDTFYVEHHLWLYLFDLWFWLLVAISGIYLFYFMCRGAMSYHWRKVWDEEEKRWKWDE